MDRFSMQHRELIAGSLSRLDRVLFNGHLPITQAQGPDTLLTHLGLKLKELRDLALFVADRLKTHALEAAEAAGREDRYPQSLVRKKQLARAIAGRDRIEPGLICVLATVSRA